MRVLQSLQRALAVLDFLAESEVPVRTSDVAARFDIDKANASRLLNTLQVAGYAERPDGRRYVVGSKLGGRDTGRQIEGLVAVREQTRVLLEGLVAASGECAHTGVLVGERIWCIDKVSSPQTLKVDHSVGALAPLHCTALGKAYLAFGPRIGLTALERRTASTIVTQSALEAELVETRKRGYAADDEEFSMGVRCVAAPVRDGGGRMIAAVGVSGPSTRIDRDRLGELGRIVRDRVAAMSGTESGNAP